MIGTSIRKNIICHEAIERVLSGCFAIKYLSNSISRSCNGNGRLSIGQLSNASMLPLPFRTSSTMRRPGRDYESLTAESNAYNLMGEAKKSYLLMM